MEKFIEWIFSTKAGKFIFLIVFSGTMNGILTLISHWFHFVPMMIGSFVIAIIMSASDWRLKWF